MAVSGTAWQYTSVLLPEKATEKAFDDKKVTDSQEQFNSNPNSFNSLLLRNNLASIHHLKKSGV